jgi:eukaryotic-like serine/threonine-protein kinase
MRVTSASSPPRSPRQPGVSDIIAGKYRLERMLKQGGMGSVWVATHLGLDEQVAIKFMDPRRVSSVESRMRFTREAKAAAGIRSKNIVQILDHGVDDHAPYIAMELLEGEDLSARLRRLGRLTIAQTSALLNDIAHALDRAHAAGIVHRDLKPENIFLAKDGDDEIPKILEFGLAREVQVDASDDSTAATAEGVILGTPYFMSPEQVRGRADIDHRSDLWSLGVIVFRAITGIRPFGRGAPADIIVQICSDPIPRASVVARDLPEEVDRFFETALARDVSKRFSSAKEMAAAFAQIAKLASSGERMQHELSGERPPAPKPQRKAPPPLAPNPAVERAMPAGGGSLSSARTESSPEVHRAPEPPHVVHAATSPPPPMEPDDRASAREILPVDLPQVDPPSVKPKRAPVPVVVTEPRPLIESVPPPASERSPGGGGRYAGWVVAGLVAVAAVGAFIFRDKLFPPQKDPSGAATIVLTAGTVVLMGPGGVRAPITAPDSTGAAQTPAAPSSAPPVAAIPSGAPVAVAPTTSPSVTPAPTLKGALPRPSSAPTAKAADPPKPKKDDRDLGY